jgi:hypothetical protein
LRTKIRPAAVRSDTGRNDIRNLDRSAAVARLASHGSLERAGIEARDANPAFDLTHEKSMVVDDETAFVKSLNRATANLTETRDYAVVTTRRHEVAEIIECFEADWHRQTFEPRDKSHIVWCPGPGRDRLCRVIDETRHRLLVQNEPHPAGAPRSEGGRHGAVAPYAETRKARRGSGAALTPP